MEIFTMDKSSMFIAQTDALHAFANQDNFWEVFETAFGQGYDRPRAEQLRNHWLAGDTGIFPTIEIISQDILGSALGAYSTSTGIIYLSDTLVATGSDSAISRVLLEEYGHYVDAQINEIDSPGDEGAIFAALVQRGGAISEPELRALQAENDRGIVLVAGRELEVEQAAMVTSTPIRVTYPNKTAGESKNCSAFAALKSDGSVVTWGGNPAMAATAVGWRAICARALSPLRIRSRMIAWCWVGAALQTTWWSHATMAERVLIK